MMKTNSETSSMHLIRFAIPTILMGLSQTLMTSIDYIFTRNLGAEVSASIAPASTLCFVPISFFLGLTSVFSTLPAQSFVNKDRKALTSYLICGLFAVSCAIPFALGLSFNAEAIVSLFGHPASVQFHEAQFLKALSLTIPGAALAFLCQNFLMLLGDSKTPSIIVMIGHVLNAVLNYTLINGIFTGKPLGLYGSALATVIATFFQGVVMLYVLLKKYNDLFTFNDLDSELLRKTVKRFLRIGLPSGFQWMQSSLVWMLFSNLIIGQLAVVQMASHNILSQVAKLATLPITGLANASTSLLAHSIGRNDRTSFLDISKQMKMIAISIALVVTVFIVSFSHFVFGLLTSDQAVLHALSNMLPFLIVYIWVSMFEALTTTKLRANNDTSFLAAISTVSLWLILVAGSYSSLSLWPSLGVRGPWIFTVISSAFTILCFRYRYSTTSPLKVRG